MEFPHCFKVMNVRLSSLHAFQCLKMQSRIRGRVMATRIVKRSRRRRNRGMRSVAGAAMRGGAIVAVAFGLFAMPADLYAAQSPFSGNTIRAKYFLTTTRCATNRGCQITTNRLRADSLIYVSTQGKIFDYTSGNSGDVSELGRPVRTSDHISTWMIQGNGLTLRTTLVGKNNLPLLHTDVTFMAAGSRCTISMKSVVPDYTVRNDVAVQTCEILPGHVER